MELEVRTEGNDVTVEGHIWENGKPREQVSVTFHGLAGSLADSLVWNSFVDGLLSRFPDLSIWDENLGRYHVCDGSRWLSSLGRFEEASDRHPPTPRP